MRKGISPVIATVIIVAVAIAISIAVAGWIMGLWGGFGQTESLKVFPDSYVNATDLVLIIQNTGGSPAQIYKIEISNTPIQSWANGTTFNGATIAPGQKATLKFAVPAGVNIAAGVAYTVTIYTESGNVYTAVVYGK